MLVTSLAGTKQGPVEAVQVCTAYPALALKLVVTNIDLIIAALGVLIALLIGSMQVYIARQQMGIAKRQQTIISLQGEIQAISSWLPFLKDKDSNIRYITVTSLERVGTEAALPPLVMALSDREEIVRTRAASALSTLAVSSTVDTKKTIGLIVPILDNQDESARKAGVCALVGIGYEYLPEIREALEDVSSSRVKPAGQEAIGKILLNEHVMRKIGALPRRGLPRGNPNVTVAILGLGVDESIPDIKNALKAKENYVEDSGEPDLATTVVARLIVGDQECDIVGVAPGVKLISERVFGENGQGSCETMVEGLGHALHHGAKVIYIRGGSSLGCGAELQQAINEAYSAGCLIVAPAGNSASEARNVPAAMENVLAVAATDAKDRKAIYSNYGEWVDIAAPGNPMQNSGVSEDQESPELKRIRALAGTSFSGAIVAGAAALVWSVNPYLSNQRVIDILLESANKLDDADPYYGQKLGAGRINVLRAVQSLQNSAE
jgi:subtilisin family serine protease